MHPTSIDGCNPSQPSLAYSSGGLGAGERFCRPDGVEGRACRCRTIPRATRIRARPSRPTPAVPVSAYSRPPRTFKRGQHRLTVAAHLHALTELLLDPAPSTRTRTVLAPVLTDRTRRSGNHDTPRWHAQLSARPHGRSPIAFVPLLHAAQHTRERSAGAVSGANTPPFKLTTTPPYACPSPPRRQDVTARPASKRDPTPP